MRSQHGVKNANDSTAVIPQTTSIPMTLIGEDVQKNVKRACNYHYTHAFSAEETGLNYLPLVSTMGMYGTDK